MLTPSFHEIEVFEGPLSCVVPPLLGLLSNAMARCMVAFTLHYSTLCHRHRHPMPQQCHLRVHTLHPFGPWMLLDAVWGQLPCTSVLAGGNLQLAVAVPGLPIINNAAVMRVAAGVS